MAVVSPEQVEQYQREGYFILESVIPGPALAALREECMRLVDDYDRDMEARGIETQGITHYKKRYFISNRSAASPIMTEFLFSELMAEICRATLGETAYLFNEQYVVKAADTDSKFAWHQDSGYVGHYHRAYLSCWCALDDMSVENGTVYILPYARDGRNSSDDIIDHTVEERTNDKVGYKGDDPGDPAIVPAGSIVVFSSRTFPHRSGRQYDRQLPALLSGAVFGRADHESRRHAAVGARRAHSAKWRARGVARLAEEFQRAAHFHRQAEDLPGGQHQQQIDQRPGQQAQQRLAPIEPQRRLLPPGAGSRKSRAAAERVESGQ